LSAFYTFTFHIRISLEAQRTVTTCDCKFTGCSKVWTWNKSGTLQRPCIFLGHFSTEIGTNDNFSKKHLTLWSI